MGAVKSSGNFIADEASAFTVTESQAVWIKVVVIGLMIIYGVTAIAIIDTMRLHEMFKSKVKNINLYCFYLLAIIVCIGRY